MKYGLTEISDLSDLALVQAYQQCLASENTRLRASKHPKFDKNNPKNIGDFPPPNPAFVQLKSEFITEMSKRKLEIDK